MNRNIEVINENLWAVNQYYVKGGYVKELVTLPGCSPEKEDACLTEDGILILNKASPVYEVCKGLMIRIIPYSDDLLKSIYELGEKSSKSRSIRIYVFSCNWVGNQKKGSKS